MAPFFSNPNSLAPPYLPNPEGSPLWTQLTPSKFNAKGVEQWRQELAIWRDWLPQASNPAPANNAMYPTGTHYELVFNLALYKFGWFCTSSRVTTGWWSTVEEAAKHKPTGCTCDCDN